MTLNEMNRLELRAVALNKEQPTENRIAAFDMLNEKFPTTGGGMNSGFEDGADRSSIDNISAGLKKMGIGTGDNNG